MALKFNNTEITSVYFNGVEKTALQYNGTGYFGKRYSLTKNTSTGVTLTVTRTSSPNQRAATGSVSTGDTIYHGDILTIGIAANANYASPKLYVNTGSGMALRTAPYTFTVTGNVTFYGTATPSEVWETVWSGSEVITGGTEYTVPGLDTSEGALQLTANVEFGQWIYDQQTGEQKNYLTETRSITRQQLPATVYGPYTTMAFERNGNKIQYTATENWLNMKGANALLREKSSKMFLKFIVTIKSHVVWVATTDIQTLCL